MQIKFSSLDELKRLQASITDYGQETTEIHAEFAEGIPLLYVVTIQARKE